MRSGRVVGKECYSIARTHHGRQPVDDMIDEDAFDQLEIESERDGEVARGDALFRDLHREGVAQSPFLDLGA